MGKTQWSYDYPEVRPPHPQAEYRAESSKPSTPSTPRYSWMDTSASEQYRQSTQSSVPPLPIVPEHLNRDLQIQPQVVREQPSTHSLPRYQPQPPVQPYNVENQHRQDLSKRQEGAVYQQSNEVAQRSPFIYTQRWQQQQLQQQQVELQFQQQQSPTSNVLPHLLQKPDPVKATPDHPHYRSQISPDRNPLSPLSPRPNPPTRQTTNRSIMSPATSSDTFVSCGFNSQPITGGQWKYSLFSCAEPTICITGLFCPCILYSRVQHRLQQRSDNKDPTNTLGHNSVNGSCVGWPFLCGINGILSGVQKTRVRRAYDMEAGSGNVFSDCFEGCCCCCCVLAQNEKEIKYREEVGRRIVTQEGYKSPSGMSFAPPPK